MRKINFLKMLYVALHKWVTFVVAIWACVPAYVGAQNVFKDQHEIDLIFPADFGRGEQIYTTSLQNNSSWSEPLQISTARKLVFHPTMAGANAQHKLAIWTQQEEYGEFLFYSIFNGEKWILAKKIDSRTKHNHSPSLIIDSTNAVWLAWEGFDDKYSDVFWSMWNGSTWLEPVMAHSINNVPDIDPKLTFDSTGKPVLSWKSFRNERYVVVSIRLEKNRNSSDSELVFFESVGDKRDFKPQFFKFPSFISNKRKAVALFKTDSGYNAITFNKLHEFEVR